MAASLRPEFEAALRYFARASKALIERGFEAPILGGGAAVELFSRSAIAKGDFDVSTSQFASGSAPEMIEQASRLLGLYQDVDRAYLDRRVREETVGDYGIDDIEEAGPA